MRSTSVDRAAAVRAAVRKLVADNGLAGASMAAVATEAGVATGTTYVYYRSKDELLLAAYLELKGQLGAAAIDGIDTAMPPHERFVVMWTAIYRFLAGASERARFLVQVDSSPMAATAHQRAVAGGDDPLVGAASAPDMASLLIALPLEVLYDLGIGPAVRLAASGPRLSDRQLHLVAEACWRSITVPD